jgi:multimeric flavodoxin WrbA
MVNFFPREKQGISMKILAIMGSPRGKGKTWQLTRQVEEHLQAADPSVEFEYVFLKDADLQTCRGCFLCLSKGEQFCPLQDERADLQAKMDAADGLIFASPVYVYNVSGLMKNFIDRFAYVCHRPRYHGKPALVVSTTGGVGLEAVLPILSFTAGAWGFNVVHRLGMAIDPNRASDAVRAAEQRQAQVKAQKAARAFLRALNTARPPVPSLVGVAAFTLQKRAFGGAAQDMADYQYWKNKGWLEPDARYYYPAPINPFKRFLAATLAGIVTRFNSSASASQG